MLEFTRELGGLERRKILGEGLSPGIIYFLCDVYFSFEFVLFFMKYYILDF